MDKCTEVGGMTNVEVQNDEMDEMSRTQKVEKEMPKKKLFTVECQKLYVSRKSKAYVKIPRISFFL